MDGKGGGVDGFVPFDDDAVLVYEDERGDGYLGEVGGEGVEPEVVGEDWVAEGDVAGYAFVEDAEGGCEVLFPVEAFFFEGLGGLVMGSGIGGGGGWRP